MACNFQRDCLVQSGRRRSSAAKWIATRVERSVFSQFLAVAFTVWLLGRKVAEAGFEPTMMLVTSVRLRGKNGMHYASGEKWFFSV